MMEVMTDNKNRTVPEIRHIMSKNGGNLGESGCVNWMFEKKGTVVVNLSEDMDEENLIELIIELEAEDFSSEGSMFEIITNPDSFEEMIEALDKNNYDVEGDIGLVPINTVKISEDDSRSIIKLLEILEDHEDVQKLYSNFEVN